MAKRQLGITCIALKLFSYGLETLQNNFFSVSESNTDLNHNHAETYRVRKAFTCRCDRSSTGRSAKRKR